MSKMSSIMRDMLEEMMNMLRIMKPGNDSQEKM